MVLDGLTRVVPLLSAPSISELTSTAPTTDYRRLEEEEKGEEKITCRRGNRGGSGVG